MGTITKDLGIATAYGYAVSKGYTGTEEEFATLMASYATVAEEAAESASEAAESASAAWTSATSAAESATSASASATTAGTAASTATTKAGEATTSASTASTAATTATTKAGEASQSATNAAVSATAAGNAQTAAETAQGKAEDAQTAAEAAQAAAEEAAASLVLDTTLTQPNQAAEAKAVGDALVNKAPVIITSASGSIANFPDGGEDLPIENLVAEIVPKQDLHGYDNPWPEGATKNKFNVFALESVTGMTINSDGTITMSNAAVRSGKTLSQIAPYLVVGETYTLVVTTSGVSNKYIYLRDISMSWNYGTSKTITQEVLNSEVNFYGEEQGTVTLSDIMIIPSTESTTPYIPYSNICPITGWDGCEVVRTGKNQFDIFKVDSVSGTGGTGSSITQNNDGTITVSTTTQANVNTTKKLSELANLKVGERYILTGDSTGTTKYIYLHAPASKVWNFNWSDVVTQDMLDSNVSFYASGQNTAAVISNVMIRSYSETDPTFAPYSGSTYPISWQSTAGTVYGGTLDVLTGVLTVDRASVTFGELNWVYMPSANIFNARVTNLLFILGNNNTIMCSGYAISPRQNSTSPDKTIYTRMDGTYTAVGVKDSAYTDATLFKSAMSGVQLCYELETPLTYQLTPVQVRTLLGQNNIWADCGDTEVEYRADTKLYIEKLTQPTEDDMVANANIASGKYFLVGNALYLSTTAIAAGETIKPGTNCTATNLAEALNTLNA